MPQLFEYHVNTAVVSCDAKESENPLPGDSKLPHNLPILPNSGDSDDSCHRTHTETIWHGIYNRGIASSLK